MALATAIIAAGCSSNDNPTPDNKGNQGDKEWVEDAPDDYLASAVFDKQAIIRYDGASAEVTLPSEAVIVRKDGAHVVIDAATHAVEGLEIVLRGGSDDGSLKIYAAKKIKLTFDGLQLASKRGAAVNNQSSKRTFVYLAPGKENTLADAAVYDDMAAGEDSKGCFFSEGQLVFNVAGMLEATSAAKHGIVSDEYVRIFSGKIVVHSAKDGLHANDYVRIDGGTLTIEAGSDGIECERGFIHLVDGAVNVISAGEGVKASGKVAGDHAPYVEVSGGNMTIKATGDKAKAVEAAQDVVVRGGSVSLLATGAAGKCLKAAGNVLISGGQLSLLTEGDALYDAGDTSSAACIRSDNGVTVSGGEILCRTSGAGGKAVNALRLNMSGGELRASATGAAFESNGLKASPKAIKLDGDATITGGRLLVSSTADEAFAAGGKITVQDGRVIADAAAGKKSYAAAGGFILSGGVAVGTGGDTEVPSSASSQRSVLLRGANAAKGALLYVTDAGGKSAVAYYTPTELTQGCFFFSTPAVASGEYTFFTGGEVSGGEEWQGLFTGGTAQGGVQQRTFTVASTVTDVASE